MNVIGKFACIALNLLHRALAWVFPPPPLKFDPPPRPKRQVEKREWGGP